MGMSKLLLNLRHVPDDEADEVRAMLDEYHIAHYETPPTFMGLFAGGLYVKEDAAFDRAKGLMAKYQSQRQARARLEREAAVRNGTAETFQSQFRAEPVRVVLTVIAIVLLIGLMAVPALLLRG
ncbi:hypothetical protein SAMN05421546_2197 [Solilutibacter tolerans]|uniref:Transmembrane protein n=2 Tax=Solilutibacter tolerans TaxID=1604334 RepID=A0A1N6XCF6_9GAMM|nr:hypothetical protein SAMN05421546_2197 [Lysobacter tolerans]